MTHVREAIPRVKGSPSVQMPVQKPVFHSWSSRRAEDELSRRASGFPERSNQHALQANAVPCDSPKLIPLHQINGDVICDPIVAQ